MVLANTCPWIVLHEMEISACKMFTEISLTAEQLPKEQGLFHKTVTFFTKIKGALYDRETDDPF